MKAQLLGVAIAGLAVAGARAHADEPGSFPEDVAGEPDVSDARLPVFDFDLQYRPRFEKAWGGDIGLALPDTSSEFTHRARIGANVWYRSLRGRISVQQIRESGFGQNLPPVELFEGFMEAHGQDWGLRVGQQMLTFDTGRILAATAWSQRSRAVDAIRFVYDRGDLAADVFAAR